MRDDLQNLQQAYQTILEEGLLDGLKKVNKAITPEPVNRLTHKIADKMSKTFLDPWMKKKPAPAADAAPTDKQRFFGALDDAAEAAGLEIDKHEFGDPAPGSIEYTKNGKLIIKIDARGALMSFYNKAGKLETIDLTHSAEDLARAKAIMGGGEYEDPADRPWGLHPSDPRR
jgi:hypothetical protein